ncbi:MAG TPA: sigma-54 dependent transcriptional regulator, partial [Candidatus Binatia bacterium]|nr:sigma-54 dependent transcriptional regulator [Candidatus Binatia bacterium]
LEILIKAQRFELAEKIIATHADPRQILTRLQAAHLAMQKKDYLGLDQLLAGLSDVPAASRDKWLYLNFIAREKNSESGPADAFAKKIRDPYYRNLAAIQWSDRKIYRGDHAGATALLNAALVFFQARQCSREEIEIQNQMAKSQREQGFFSAAETIYKNMFIRCESEGFGLNSAYTAVDLGNLYLENDDDFQAEGWYKKALRRFEKEKNRDGIMLVNANLIGIFIGAGNWQEAETLLRDSLAYNEEKKLPVSCAIDCLNWAHLETVRRNYAQAWELLERAALLFVRTVNNKGLAECALRQGEILFAENNAPDPRLPGIPSLHGDQKIAWKLCQLRAPALGKTQAAAIKKELSAIRSKKTRFTALAMLLKKYNQPEWLDMLRDVARELSEKSKNYYFFEYWYAYFELNADLQDGNAATKDTFLAMHDFFSMNKRRCSEKIDRLRMVFAENDHRGRLFNDARLVENHRQWKVPEDFFNSFLHEINRGLHVDWLAMRLYEKERLLFDFSSSPLFKELGDEMLQAVRRQPEKQNLRLAEIRTKFLSREKFFYPFANTKMMSWPLTGDLCADLVVAFRDGEAYFQNFFERNREVLAKFSVLFHNFFYNEFQVQKKLAFIIGSSEKIREMKGQITQVSKVDFSLLISGESGSGKELVAQAVHRLSPRADRPFVSVNAAALPETLLEAELFGYKKGAFSGAAENRVGLLEAADRGTFFLDEIGDLPLNLQAKILRVLQEKEIRRLGENKTIAVDIRLISASNKNLQELIKANRFREDLFYRLQDLTIHIPPLRERREDIPLLVAHFLEKYGRPANDPLTLQGIAVMFQSERFPGNVRELESKIKKLITFNPGLERILPVKNSPSGLKLARQNFERTLLLDTLHETGWNKKKAAEKLAISRMGLFNLLKKHHVKQ